MPEPDGETGKHLSTGKTADAVYWRGAEMLNYEWRELEVLCDRISALRHRYARALRSSNVGLIEGLKDELSKAQHQRERLVHHISARLSSAAVEDPVEPSPAYPPLFRRRPNELNLSAETCTETSQA